MKYLYLILFCLFCYHITVAQNVSEYIYDADSNKMVVVHGDTQYVQEAYTAKMVYKFGSNTTFINTDKSYRNRPHFKGNVAKYLKRNLQYPKAAIDRGIEGKIRVTFIVDKEGQLHNIRTSKGNSELVKEARRLVENMPPWQPALDKTSKKPIDHFGGIVIPFELY